MSPRVRPSRREAAGPAFPGPLMMLFPLLLLVATITYFSGRSPDPGPIPAPPLGETSIRVAAWLGEARGAGGEQLRVRLHRLHRDAERQAFDAASLARRLDLGSDEGYEPWRLELHYLGDAETSPRLALAKLAIHDAEGEAQRPLLMSETPPDDSVADPLAVLLAPPPFVRAGEIARMVLWGREPSGSAELKGLFEGIALRADQVESTHAGDTLASLERTIGTDETETDGEDR